MWRKRYGGLVWSRFEKWRAKGLNPVEDASLDRILPEPSMENCIEQMVYRAWREAYNRAAADGDKAAESFARECGDAMMRNCLPEEAAHALQNQNRKIFVLQEEAVPLLAAISMAAQPHAVLADLCSYGTMEPDSPYRKACDEAVPALAEEALKLARSNKDVAAMFGKEIPASAEAARALLYRLDEKSIRAAAAAALKSLESKAGGAAPAPVLAPLRAN
jgi:hypothetical protein